MENIKVVIEDIKSLRRNAKDMLEKEDSLEKKVFEIRQLAKKENDIKKEKNIKMQ